MIIIIALLVVIYVMEQDYLEQIHNKDLAIQSLVDYYEEHKGLK